MESLSHLRVLNQQLHAPAPRDLPAQAGFTLIEMLVVLAIIIIVTAIALAGQSGFNRTEALNNMAYDIGLAIRQAESYGVANAINSSGAGQGNNLSYGVYFSNASGWDSHFYLFADTAPGVGVTCQGHIKPDCKPGDHEYNGSDTMVQDYTLNNGFTINAFCVTDGSHHSCTNGGSSPLQKLAITFGRPNAQVTIAGFDQGAGDWVTTYTYACIQLHSAANETRYIGVSQNGEILAGTQAVVDPNSLCPTH